MATYLDKSTLQTQVQKDIDAVKQARSDGVAKLQNKWLGGEGAQASIDSINALPIDDWAKRGLDAVNGGDDPSANGWPGWQQAGQTYISGINDLTDLGLSATLDNITATAKEVVEDIDTVDVKTVAAVKKTAKKIVTKTVDAADAVVKTAVVIVKPSTHFLGIAAAVVVLLLIVRSHK